MAHLDRAVQVGDGDADREAFGRQVADAARPLRPALQVLFITGFAENAAVGNGLMAPGMELLTKPFLMAGLAKRVCLMLEG